MLLVRAPEQCTRYRGFDSRRGLVFSCVELKIYHLSFFVITRELLTLLACYPSSRQDPCHNETGKSLPVAQWLECPTGVWEDTGSAVSDSDFFCPTLVTNCFRSSVQEYFSKVLLIFQCSKK